MCKVTKEASIVLETDQACLHLSWNLDTTDSKVHVKIDDAHASAPISFDVDRKALREFCLSVYNALEEE